MHSLPTATAAPGPARRTVGRVPLGRVRFGPVRFGAVLLAVLLGAVLLAAHLAAAGPASAHTELIGSEPAQDATVEVAPPRVTLTFSEPVGPKSASVTVTDPDGTSVTAGSPAFSGGTVTQPLAGPAVPGRYTVTFRISSLDGHRSSGRRTFDYVPVQAASQPPEPSMTTTPAPTRDGPTRARSDADSTGRLALGFIGLVALLVLGGTGVSWVRRGGRAA